MQMENIACGAGLPSTDVTLESSSMDEERAYLQGVDPNSHSGTGPSSRKYVLVLVLWIGGIAVACGITFGIILPQRDNNDLEVKSVVSGEELANSPLNLKPPSSSPISSAPREATAAPTVRAPLDVTLDNPGIISSVPTADPTTPLNLRGSGAPSVETTEPNFPNSEFTPTLPTPSPTERPTTAPILLPTRQPSNSPTEKPTAAPIASSQPPPTFQPTPSPTDLPMERPTTAPILLPTRQPTNSPTEQQLSPTFQPTLPPTPSPTDLPTERPTTAPILLPTRQPTNSPTERPTTAPIVSSTPSPTHAPSTRPSSQPPTLNPLISSTFSPSLNPTDFPTDSPTNSPTNSPTRDCTTVPPPIENGCDGKHKLSFEMQTDKWGEDISWTLDSDEGTVLEISMGTYGPNQNYVSEVCVPPGVHNLTLYDKYGDGLCCRYGNGYYKVSIDEREVLVAAKHWFYEYSHIINVGYNPCEVMTERDYQYLESHNTRRKTWHEESGMSYVPLLWSPTLAVESLSWANALLDDCDVVGIEHEPGVVHGENLAKNHGSGGWGQLYPPERIVNRWVDFEIGWAWPDNAHLTQALWRASQYLGCGESVKVWKGGFCRVQVCRYARAGNCDMGSYNSTEGRNWRIPMLMDVSPCGEACPQEGCF